VDSDLIRRKVAELEGELIRIRRDLHRHPELGFEEHRTASVIAKWLNHCDVRVREGVVGTGVVGVIEGGRPGRTIGVRVDIDALNISDNKDVAYASSIPELCHACGHDVHTTIGLGVAKIVAELRSEFAGAVKLIFQPAEEVPKPLPGKERDVYTEYPKGQRAADLAIKEGVLEDPRLDRLLGIHCWPSLKAGQIGYEYGPAMAGNGNFHIAVLGRGGHAATPHRTIDPMPIMAEVILALQTIISRKTEPGSRLVVTIGTIHGGRRRSIISDRVDITGTVRGLDTTVLEKEVSHYIERMVKGITEAHGAGYICEYGLDIPPVINDDDVVRDTSISLRKILGNDAVELKEAPMTAEDFSYMARLVPSIYMKLGTANENESTRFPLHNPNFDVDEACIACGVRGILQVIFDFLEQPRPILHA